MLTLLSACTMVLKDAETVSGFELDRYLGKWYEIVRLDHSFERGLNRVYGGHNILARSPNLDTFSVEQLVEKAQQMGFPVGDLIYVLHD